MKFDIKNHYSTALMNVKTMDDQVLLKQDSGVHSMHFFMEPNQAREMASALLACADAVETALEAA